MMPRGGVTARSTVRTMAAVTWELIGPAVDIIFGSALSLGGAYLVEARNERGLVAAFDR